MSFSACSCVLLAFAHLDKAIEQEFTKVREFYSTATVSGKRITIKAESESQLTRSYVLSAIHESLVSKVVSGQPVETNDMRSLGLKLKVAIEDFVIASSGSKLRNEFHQIKHGSANSTILLDTDFELFYSQSKNHKQVMVAGERSRLRRVFLSDVLCFPPIESWPEKYVKGSLVRFSNALASVVVNVDSMELVSAQVGLQESRFGAPTNEWYAFPVPRVITKLYLRSLAKTRSDDPIVHYAEVFILDDVQNTVSTDTFRMSVPEGTVIVLEPQEGGERIVSVSPHDVDMACSPFFDPFVMRV